MTPAHPTTAELLASYLIWMGDPNRTVKQVAPQLVSVTCSTRSGVTVSFLVAVPECMI